MELAGDLIIELTEENSRLRNDKAELISLIDELRDQIMEFKASLEHAEMEINSLYKEINLTCQ